MMYASWAQRVGALLIDEVIVVVPIIIGFVIMAGTTGADGSPTGTGVGIYVGTLAIAVVLAIYNRCFRAGRTGQSWGRQALGIRLVGEDGDQPIGAGKAFLREIAHIVDTLPLYLGYLWPLWDAKRQTFADKVARTMVVEA